MLSADYFTRTKQFPGALLFVDIETLLIECNKPHSSNWIFDMLNLQTLRVKPRM